MSEEEKQAMETINDSYDNNTGYVECEAKVWNIVVNYIDKLQKENEKLKEENEELKKDNKGLNELLYFNNKIELPYTTSLTSTDDFISKDKIRDKIKELEEKCETIKKTYKGTYALNGNYLEAFSQIIILRELLEE